MTRSLLPILALTLVLSGCAQIKTWIPSFWDDNQSMIIVRVQQNIEAVNCSEPQLAQVEAIARELRTFELYSAAKGWRQQDVLKLTQPMRESLDDWLKRSQKGEGSETYCKIKRALMEKQSKTAAQAVLGRF